MSTEPSFDIFDPTTPVLECRLARFEGVAGYEHGFDRVNFTLRNGELMLVRHVPREAGFRLADVAQGLVSPSKGEVLYLGLDWAHTLAFAAEKKRGEIGRVFVKDAWVSNLDLEENVFLRLKHRGLFGKRRFKQDAERALARFGLEALPQIRPSDVPAETLQLAQWVRAFAGSPKLVILEHPISRDDLPADRLWAAVDEVRKTGGAVLWITSREDVWSNPDLDVSQRFEVQGDRLVAVAEES